MTSLIFRPPVCATCGHEYTDHVMDPDDLDRIAEQRACTALDCGCVVWVLPLGGTS